MEYDRTKAGSRNLRAHIGRSRVDLGQSWVTSGQVWSESSPNEVGPMLADSGSSLVERSPNTTEFAPSLVELGPNLVVSGSLAGCGQFRASVGRISSQHRPNSGPMLAASGPCRSTPDRDSPAPTPACNRARQPEGSLKRELRPSEAPWSSTKACSGCA